MTPHKLAERRVNQNFDSDPSFHHVFNFKIAKSAIENKNVLDIGCWTGQFEGIAAKIAKKITGLDPNKFAINYASKKFPNVNFIVGTALNLPFNDNSFDTVVFLEVIEHLPKGEETIALKEIKRVLKPNGILVLSTPNKHLLSILLDPAYFLIGHRHYSVSQIKSLLAKTNFKVSKVYITGGLVRLIWSNIEYITKHLLKKSIDLPKWIKNKIKSEYRSGFAELHFIAKNEK